MRAASRSNAPAVKSSTISTHSLRFIALPIIKIGLTAYGALCLTVVWLTELALGSIAFCGAILSVAVEALQPRFTSVAKPTPPEAPQFSAKSLAHLARVWREWADNPRCEDPKQARINADYYDGLLSSLKPPSALAVRMGLAPSSCGTRGAPDGIRANLRGIPNLTERPQLAAHELEPVEMGVVRPAPDYQNAGSPETWRTTNRGVSIAKHPA